MEPDAPLNLDNIGRTGTEMFGRPAKRVIVFFEGGDQADIPMPPASDNALSPTQQKMLKVLADASEPLSRKELALALKRSRADGKFGDDIRLMKSRGKILEVDGEITNDASKFGQLT